MLPLEKLTSSFREAQSKLVVQTADLPLATLAQMVEDNAIDLQPGFQRRERWSPDKQSALIESFLLNVPVPAGQSKRLTAATGPMVAILRTILISDRRLTGRSRRRTVPQSETDSWFMEVFILSALRRVQLRVHIWTLCVSSAVVQT